MNFEERVGAGTLRREDVGRRVMLAGWVQRRRDFGDLIFVDLRDRSGLCQIVVDLTRADASVVAGAKELRSEYVVRFEGNVVERAPEQRNPKLDTGDIEILASAVHILNRADTPPFPIEEDVNAAEDLRLKYRYLDLRRKPLTKNLVLRDRISFRVRDYLHRNGFLEIETPILTKSTPEGARDFLVPSRVQQGEFYALPQSPQLFKQLLMVSGLERYYQLARCFRDEDLRSDRQYEFTQVDVEASFIDEEVIYRLIEGMFAEIFPAADIAVATPFRRMTWSEAMERFGIDRPDLRFGMELRNLDAAVEGIDFAPFKSALAEKGIVRGIVAPNAAGFSRKRIDELTEYAKVFGATGLIWIKFEKELASSIKKFLAPADVERLKNALAAADGEIALVVAGKRTVVLDTLANLRLRLGREEKLIDPERWEFLWVVDFPLFEYDEKEHRFAARHHPFTSPVVADLDKIESNPAEAFARAYDIILNGLELGGGSIRINTPEVQSRMFRALGIDEKQAEERFGFLLEAFRYGAPPHGGIALGLDRMVMLMARAQSIRDVIAFPKTTRGQDLMTDAPSVVDDEQLRELGIALRDRT
jgi:aspartyl-tRNA synthetase